MLTNGNTAIERLWGPAAEGYFGICCDRGWRRIIDVDDTLSLPDKITQRHNERANDHEIEFTAGQRGNRFRSIDILFPFQSVGREFDRPGEEQGQRKAEYQQE